MSQTITARCDRCGAKDLTEMQSRGRPLPSGQFATVSVTTWVLPSRELDLCGPCVDDFDTRLNMWLKERTRG